MCGEAHCTEAIWIFLDISDFLKICCWTICRGSLHQQHAKNALISFVFHWYLKYRSNKKQTAPLMYSKSNTAFAKTQIVAALSSGKNKTKPNLIYGHTQFSSAITEQHLKVQLLPWIWTQDTCKVTQHAKNAAGIVICFLRKAQLWWSTCFSARSCLSPNFQWGWLGYKRRSSDLPKVTQWVIGSHGIRNQEAPGSTFLGLITSPYLLQQYLALSFTEKGLHGVTLFK